MVSDALIKQQLSDFQFAWDNNLVDKLVQHEIEIMRPVIEFARDRKGFTADEVVLGNSCHLDVAGATVNGLWEDSYRQWYDAGKRIGQFTFPYEDFVVDYLAPKYIGWYKVYGESIRFSLASEFFSIDRNL